MLWLPTSQRRRRYPIIPALLDSMHDVAATIGDKILTPLRWNALADAIYGFSRYEDPVERNALVRSLFDPDFIALLDSERDELVFRAVGMFRLNYSSSRPSPFAATVYEKVKDHPLFQQAWNRRIVSGDLTYEKVLVRNHPLVGRITVFAIDFSTPMRPDLMIRTVVPSDEETQGRFQPVGGARNGVAGTR